VSISEMREGSRLRKKAGDVYGVDSEFFRAWV